MTAGALLSWVEVAGASNRSKWIRWGRYKVRYKVVS
jgi:hypothetical protein